MASENGNGGERFTGHGSEWTDANLSKEDAQVATVWVDQIVNRRSMLTNKDRVEDVRDIMWHLEKDGEIVVHRVTATNTIRSRLRPCTAGTSVHTDDAALAPQVLRSVRQHPGISGITAVAHERDGHQVPGRDRPDLVHRLELSRLRYRQYRKSRGRVPAQFPPGVRVRQGAGPARGLLLSARSLRHLVRQLQGSAWLSAAVSRSCASGSRKFSASSVAWSTASC